MRKIYILLFVVLAGFTTKAQIINFPDANFKAKLLSASPSNMVAKNTALQYAKIDTNNNLEIEVSEAQQIVGLNLGSASITSLEGILGFTNLKSLGFDQNQVASVNLTGLDLTVLTCSNNALTSLNLSGMNNLLILYCNYNQLTSLDLSNLPALTTVQCYNNLLTSLTFNAANVALANLNCKYNHLATIDITPLINLDDFAIDHNLLTSLNFGSLNKITRLNTQQNTTLTGGLDLSNFNLMAILVVDNNNLTDANFIFNAGPSLQSILCRNNSLTTLDLSNATSLTDFSISGNPLETLFIKNGRDETNDVNLTSSATMKYVCADESQFTYLSTRIPATCQLNSYCYFNPGGTVYTIQGSHKLDSNNNGCDNNDVVIPNLKFQVAGGSATGYFMSAANGDYSLSVNSGSYILTPRLENPSFFNVSPTSVSVNFPTQTSPYNQNFCITPNGIHQDADIIIVPMNDARPGFDASYKIIYKNKGNQVTSGSISLSFNDSVLDLVYASDTVSGQSTNTLQWNFNSLQPFETRTIILKFNVNTPMETPPVNGGDILRFIANISITGDEFVFDNTAELNQIVVNSLDPNDKTCVEGTTVSPSMVGQYVHYIIRFENTGTVNADHVVISDVIDTAKFDVTSLIPLHGSHPFKTRIVNTNKVEFYFDDINLPFDDANNDGYVVFKIKTKPTLVVGNTFSNTANIYFDYNFPITTNTYTTTVTALNNNDFEFNEAFSLSPVPTKDKLTITAKQSIEISSVNIYNTIGQLVHVTTNPAEIIDVSGLKSGTYFIKITSDKGTSATKFIKE